MRIVKGFKKIIPIFLSLALILVATGCGGINAADEEKTSSGDKGMEVYYINNDDTGLESRPYSAIKKKNPLVMARELIKSLSADPPELTLQKCIQNANMVKNITFDNNEITVDFSSMYNNEQGITEVLRRAGIVKTLCQIPEVKYVTFTVEGQSLVLNGTKPVGRMSGDDFINNTGGETTYYQDVQIALFYTDKSGTVLKPSRHNIVFDGTISLEQLVVEQLLDGPLPEENLRPVIPEGTELNSVSVKDGLCIVDLSKEFLDRMVDVSPKVTVYAIVNSLVEINEVSKVEITVDGNPIKKYQEKVKLSSPLERNLDIVSAD